MLSISQTDLYQGHNPNLLDGLSCKLSEQLTLFEAVTDSPELRQALTHAELIISRIRAYYNATQVHCRQAIITGTQFAASLSNLVNCIGLGTVQTTKLQSENFPKPNLIVDLDQCDIQQILMQTFYIMKQFAQQTNDFVVKLEDLQHILMRAINHLNRLFEIRAKFQRTYDQLEGALNRAASINVARAGTDLAEVDEMVCKSLQSYKSMATTYLAHVRSAFGSGHLASYLRLLVVVISGEYALTDHMYDVFHSVPTKRSDVNENSTDQSVEKNGEYFDNLSLVNRLQQLANTVESHQRECCGPTSPLPQTPVNSAQSNSAQNKDKPKLVEGYLFKRTGKRGFRTWSRRWFCIFNNQLIYCKRFAGLRTTDLQAASDLAFNEINYQVTEPNTRNFKMVNGILNNDFENGPLAHYLLQAAPKWTILEGDLRFCTARICTATKQITSKNYDNVNNYTPSTNERRHTFQLVSSDNKIHYLQASNEADFNMWYTALQSGLNEMQMSNYPIKRNNSDWSISRVKNRTVHRNLSLSTKPINYEALRNQGGLLLVHEPDLAENRFCTDCHVEGSTWASINLGVTLCTQCASIHRSLGVHVSKVRSLTLDHWQPENLHVMFNLGNKLVNELYEANWPAFSKEYPQLTPSCTNEKRRYWIRAKYVQCLFAQLPLGSLSTSRHSETFDWLRKLYADWLNMQNGNLENYLKLSGQLLGPKRVQTLISHLQNEDILNELIESLKEIYNQCGNICLLPSQRRAKILQDPEQQTAAKLFLNFGARLSCPLIMRIGLLGGASPNDALGPNELPPIILASRTGSMAACEFLLLNGADINVTDCRGRTALYHACQSSQVNITCLLLRRQANQMITGNDGKLPLDVAMALANADIVTLLRLQRLHSLSNESGINSTDETVVDVFSDFTMRAYELDVDDGNDEDDDDDDDCSMEDNHSQDTPSNTFSPLPPISENANVNKTRDHRRNDDGMNDVRVQNTKNCNRRLDNANRCKKINITKQLEPTNDDNVDSNGSVTPISTDYHENKLPDYSEFHRTNNKTVTIKTTDPTHALHTELYSSNNSHSNVVKLRRKHYNIEHVATAKNANRRSVGYRLPVKKSNDNVCYNNDSTCADTNDEFNSPTIITIRKTPQKTKDNASNRLIAQDNRRRINSIDANMSNLKIITIKPDSDK